MSFTQVTIEADVQNNLENVWKYWNTPDHIKNWNFASPDWHCPKSENDLRVGGKFKARMEAKDGSFGFDFEGLYTEVIPMQKISYVLEDGRKVTNTFQKTNSGTRIVTIFDAEKENTIERQKFGWQSILNSFKQYAESLK